MYILISHYETSSVRKIRTVQVGSITNHLNVVETFDNVDI